MLGERGAPETEIMKRVLDWIEDESTPSAELYKAQITLKKRFARDAAKEFEAERRIAVALWDADPTEKNLRSNYSAWWSGFEKKGCANEGNGCICGEIGDSYVPKETHIFYLDPSMSFCSLCLESLSDKVLTRELEEFELEVLDN